MHAVFFLHGNIRAGANLVMLRHAVHLAGAHRVSVVFQHDWFPLDISFVPGHEVLAPVLLRDYAEAGPADIAITNWWTCAFDFPLISARRYAYYRHGDERALYPTPVFEALLGWIDRERFAWLCVNEHLAAPLRRAGHDVLVLPPGVDVARFRDAAPALPPCAKVLRVLVEGPLDAPHKRTGATLDMLRGVGGIEIVHFSADGARPEGIDHALGAVPHGDVAGIAASCDLIVKLGAVESFGMPILEQFAAGGTAVVTAHPGQDQLIASGRNALSVDVGDPFEPARAALLGLMADPDRLRALRQGAQATAARFDWLGLHQDFAAFLDAQVSEGDAIQALPVAEAYRSCLAAVIDLWARDAARGSGE